MTLLCAAILLLTVGEGAALTWWHRRTGRGIRPGQLWPNLAAGAALTSALLLAVAGAASVWLLLPLAAALAAHVADLRSRWPRGSRRDPL